MAKIEILDGAGAVVGTFIAEEGEAIEKHFPAYPEAVAFREVDPAVVLAAEAAKRELQEQREIVERDIVAILLDHENRLRKLEGKALIMAKEFFRK